ncbi:MAG: hypothetical protein H6510_16685 [Acidobacteria bacterium]|nr:hypothetical protein [Acidobacteriota bacterium]
MGLFRLNHQAEQAFYRTSPPHNTARFHAWCLLKGLPQVPPEELSVTPQNKDSVHYYQIHQDEVSFYVIPQKK